MRVFEGQTHRTRPIQSQIQRLEIWRSRRRQNQACKVRYLRNVMLQMSGLSRLRRDSYSRYAPVDLCNIDVLIPARNIKAITAGNAVQDINQGDFNKFS